MGVASGRITACDMPVWPRKYDACTASDAGGGQIRDFLRPHNISLTPTHILSVCPHVCAAVSLSCTDFTVTPCSKKGRPAYHTSTFLGGKFPVIESVSAGAGTRQKVSPVCERATGTACETGSGRRRSVGCLLFEAPPPGGLLMCCRPPERLCVVVCV